MRFMGALVSVDLVMCVRLHEDSEIPTILIIIIFIIYWFVRPVHMRNKISATEMLNVANCCVIIMYIEIDSTLNSHSTEIGFLSRKFDSNAPSKWPIYLVVYGIVIVKAVEITVLPASGTDSIIFISMAGFTIIWRCDELCTAWEFHTRQPEWLTLNDSKKR